MSHTASGIYVNETSNIADWGHTHDEVDHKVIVELGDPRIKKISRIRLLSDPGFPMWDLSYAVAELKDGKLVVLDLGQHQFTKGKLNSELIAIFKAAKFFQRNIFNDGTISKLN